MEGADQIAYKYVVLGKTIGRGDLIIVDRAGSHENDDGPIRLSVTQFDASNEAATLPTTTHMVCSRLLSMVRGNDVVPEIITATIYKFEQETDLEAFSIRLIDPPLLPASLQ